jgi:hypothetical protein
VLFSDLTAYITALCYEKKFKVDRVVSIHLANISKKNTKGGMLMDVAYCVVFLPAKSKLAVTVNKDSPGLFSQIWSLKYVGKSEHKV